MRSCLCTTYWMEKWPMNAVTYSHCDHASHYIQAYVQLFVHSKHIHNEFLSRKLTSKRTLVLSDSAQWQNFGWSYEWTTAAAACEAGLFLQSHKPTCTHPDIQTHRQQYRSLLYVFLLAQLQTWRAITFSRVCLSVCLWPALLPFNVNRFWRNLVTRTLLW